MKMRGSFLSQSRNSKEDEKDSKLNNGRGFARQFKSSKLLLLPQSRQQPANQSALFKQTQSAEQQQEPHEQQQKMRHQQHFIAQVQKNAVPRFYRQESSSQLDKQQVVMDQESLAQSRSLSRRQRTFEVNKHSQGPKELDQSLKETTDISRRLYKSFLPSIARNSRSSFSQDSGEEEAFQHSLDSTCTQRRNEYQPLMPQSGNPSRSFAWAPRRQASTSIHGKREVGQCPLDDALCKIAERPKDYYVKLAAKMQAMDSFPLSRQSIDRRDSSYEANKNSSAPKISEARAAGGPETSQTFPSAEKLSRNSEAFQKEKPASIDVLPMQLGNEYNAFFSPTNQVKPVSVAHGRDRRVYSMKQLSQPFTPNVAPKSTSGRNLKLNLSGLRPYLQSIVESKNTRKIRLPKMVKVLSQQCIEIEFQGGGTSKNQIRRSSQKNPRANSLASNESQVESAKSRVAKMINICENINKMVLEQEAKHSSQGKSKTEVRAVERKTSAVKGKDVKATDNSKLGGAAPSGAKEKKKLQMLHMIKHINKKSYTSRPAGQENNILQGNMRDRKQPRQDPAQIPAQQCKQAQDLFSEPTSSRRGTPNFLESRYN